MPGSKFSSAWGGVRRSTLTDLRRDSRDTVVLPPGRACHEVQDVVQCRVRVPTSERTKAPVRLDCGQTRVVGVERVISRVLQRCGQATTEHKRPNAVVDAICYSTRVEGQLPHRWISCKKLTLCLVKGEYNECAVVIEACVAEDRFKPVLNPLTYEIDICVVALVPENVSLHERIHMCQVAHVIHKIGSNEAPLWHCTRVQVSREVVDCGLVSDPAIQYALRYAQLRMRSARSVTFDTESKMTSGLCLRT